MNPFRVALLLIVASIFCMAPSLDARLTNNGQAKASNHKLAINTGHKITGGHFNKVSPKNQKSFGTHQVNFSSIHHGIKR